MDRLVAVYFGRARSALLSSSVARRTSAGLRVKCHHEVATIPPPSPSIYLRPNAHHITLRMPTSQMPSQQRRRTLKPLPQYPTFQLTYPGPLQMSQQPRNPLQKSLSHLPPHLPRASPLPLPTSLTHPQPCPANPPSPSPTPCTCEMGFCVQSWPESCYCGNAQKQRCFTKCGGVQPNFQVPPSSNRSPTCLTICLAMSPPRIPLPHHNRQSQTCWPDQGSSDIPGDCDRVLATP